MRNIVIRAALGLSVVVGGLAMATPASAFVLKNLQAQENNQQICMGVSGANSAPGTPIIVWDCDGHPDQTWNFDVLSQGWTRVEDAAWSNRCLDAKDGDTANGTPLVISTCDTISDEGFTMTFAGSDQNGHSCYRFTNVNSGRTVGVSAGNVENGTPVILWDYLGHADQFWCLY
jgi:Ricin-type beta-trefoil lectin domain